MRTITLVACAALLSTGLSGCGTVNGAMSGMNNMMSRATLSDGDLSERTTRWLHQEHQVTVDPATVSIVSRELRMMELHWNASVPNRGTYQCMAFYNMGGVSGDTCRLING